MTDTTTTSTEEVKARKPLHKRWWVYAIAAVVIGASLNGGGNDSATVQETFEEVSSGLNQGEAPAPTVAEQQFSVSQENAIRSAESYIDVMAFSREGLIDQLEYEGFPTDEATFAVDHIAVDWNEQAAKSAESYLETMPFSRSELIGQLEYEGFTTSQATFGVDSVGL